MNTSRLILRLVFTFLPLGLITPATAANNPTTTPPNEPDGEVRLGAFALSGINIKLSGATLDGRRGTSVDFVDELGADRSLTVFRADANWHFSGGNGLDASWYDIDNKGTRAIDKEFDFGDTVFPIHTTLESRIRTNIYKFDYGYTFRRGKPHQFTALIGAHVMRVQTTFSAPSLQREASFSATAPLPAFGLGWKARWTERFSTNVTAQFFKISLEGDKYSGHFVDFLAAAQYRFSKSFGIGGGYNRFDLKATFKGDRIRLDFDQKYNGFLAYLFAEF